MQARKKRADKQKPEQYRSKIVQGSTSRKKREMVIDLRWLPVVEDMEMMLGFGILGENALSEKGNRMLPEAYRKLVGDMIAWSHLLQMACVVRNPFLMLPGFVQIMFSPLFFPFCCLILGKWNTLWWGYGRSS